MSKGCWIKSFGKIGCCLSHLIKSESIWKKHLLLAVSCILQSSNKEKFCCRIMNHFDLGTHLFFVSSETNLWHFVLIYPQLDIIGNTESVDSRTDQIQHPFWQSNFKICWVFLYLHSVHTVNDRNIHSCGSFVSYLVLLFPAYQHQSGDAWWESL